MRYLIATIQGVSPIAARELKRMPSAGEVVELGSDGRTDLLTVDMERGADPPAPRSAEDVFVALGEVAKVKGLDDLLRRIWDEQVLGRALSVYGTHVGPLKTRMTFRVVARVRSEALFKRTELRDQLVEQIARAHPRWKLEDPAALEFWVAETKVRTFVLGLRLTLGARSRRVVERPGALRPSVAGAMVSLAGTANGSLLDPMCGSGTILDEASEAGWTAFGSDIDASVLPVAQRNSAAALVRADARALPFEVGSVQAVVSNLPFGKRFPIQGDAGRFFRDVLRACAAVAMPTGRVVLLVPPSRAFEQALEVTALLHTTDRFSIDLLGEQTTIWSLFRDQRPFEADGGL